MKRKVCIIGIMLIVTILAYSQSQTVYKTSGDLRLSPRLLNYQGYLTDTQGNPVTNPTASMTFAIFDAASAGNQKWSETQPSVVIDKGIFNVLLGSVTPIPDSVFLNSTNRYLQLTLAGQVLSPRTRIVSAPYAYTATYSDTAQYARASAPDNDWTFRVTDVSDTTLQMVGQWGIARAGNVLYGNVDRTHTNFGVDCTTGTDGQNLNYCTVSGGYRNKARSRSSTVGGGYCNTADSSYATVGGGSGNTASGWYAIIGGGGYNTAEASLATVGGGYYNRANGYAATVGGGYADTASGQYATVGGGIGNTASNEYAMVGGGNDNTASGRYATVAGGYRNTADSSYATVGGGYDNDATGQYAAVGGGYYNVASGRYATVAGGSADTARGDYATVGGGYSNTAGGLYAIVGGGANNTTSDSCATVGGGWANTASGFYATVGGGAYNTASGQYATVGGGYAAAATHYGEQAYASGFSSAYGDAQTSVYVLRRSGAGELFLNGSSERLTIASNRRLTFDILVIAGDNSAPRNSAGYRINGLIENSGGTTVFVGTPAVTILGEDQATWNVSVTANDTYDALVITATGTARWVATARTIELTY